MQFIKGSIPPEEGHYYVNDSMNRVLCFQDGQWFKAVKDRQGRYCFIQQLDKQPRIKSFYPYKDSFR